MSLRVLIDGRKLCDGGIGVYIENLVNGLISLKYSPNITLLTTSAAACCESLKNGWGDKIRIEIDDTPKYSFNETFLISQRKKDLIAEHDLFHSPHYTLPLGIKIPTVTTVHDIIHVTHPDTKIHKPVSKLAISSAIKRSTKLITVSYSSLHAIKNQFGDSSVDKFAVVHNAIRNQIQRLSESEVSEALSRNRIDSPYYLYVGPDRPHKGFKEILKAFSKIDGNIKLLCITNQLTEWSKNFIESNQLSERVVLLDHVENHDLSAFYQGTLGCIVASKEEGFGLVALEAMVCGAPLISTPVSSIFEVCGDYPLYLDGFDSESILRGISQISSHDWHRKVTDSRSRLAAYSIEKHGIETLRVYEQAVSLEKNKTFDPGFKSPLYVPNKRSINKSFGLASAF